MKRANRNKEAQEARRIGAAERAQYYATLTPEQKIAHLDARLGKGVGAEKERARLAKLIAERAQPPTPEKAAEVFGGQEKPKKQKGKTKKQRKQQAQ